MLIADLDRPQQPTARRERQRSRRVGGRITMTPQYEANNALSPMTAPRRIAEVQAVIVS